MAFLRIAIAHHRLMHLKTQCGYLQSEPNVEHDSP